MKKRRTHTRGPERQARAEQGARKYIYVGRLCPLVSPITYIYTYMFLR